MPCEVRIFESPLPILNNYSPYVTPPGYGLARMFDQAFKRSTDLAAIFEANPFAAAHVCGREVQLATSLPILQATPEYRSFVLTMSAWVGALQACRHGYWEVVEPLVKGACQMAVETRGLWRLSQNFMMFLLQVVHALKEPSAESVAAVASRILLTKELHGDEETHWRTLLDECAAGNVPAYLYTPAKLRCDSLHSSRAFCFCFHSIFVHVQSACCACVICHPLGYFQEIKHQRLF